MRGCTNWCSYNNQPGAFRLLWPAIFSATKDLMKQELKAGSGGPNADDGYAISPASILAPRLSAIKILSGYALFSKRE